MRINAFYNRIGSVMKDNMYDRTVVGYRSGSIANRTLYKTQIENQTRVFARKQERENKQYSISILLDVSGSMKGERGTRNNRFCLIFTDGQSGDEIEQPLKDVMKIAKVFPFGISMDLAYSHGFGMKVCNKDMFMFKMLRALENNISRG